MGQDQIIKSLTTYIKDRRIIGSEQRKKKAANGATNGDAKANETAHNKTVPQSI